MKLGRKKPTLPCSSRPSLMSHVLPATWLTKFKQISLNPVERYAKAKRKGKCEPETLSSPQLADGGRFYGGDGEDFWRLSFGEDGFDGQKSRSVLNSVRQNSDDDSGFAASSCQTVRSHDASEYYKEFTNSVSGLRKIRGLTREVEIFREMETDTRGKLVEIRTPRLILEVDRKHGKARKKALEERQLKFDEEKVYEAECISTESTAKNGDGKGLTRTSRMIERKDGILPANYSSRENCYVSSKELYTREIEGDSMYAAGKESDGLSMESLSCEWQKLKKMKIEELKSRSKGQRKSVYISREIQRKGPKQSSKVRVYSPRTVEICKVKALEDKKKAKSRTKKEKSSKGLESVAVVTLSSDPYKDFRDSMIEMIQEKGISRSEELEELLACYLTLNSDEYHNLIIKVFRHVWFELKKAFWDSELETEHSLS
ncbi:hypothetical protein K2173_005414 [Erythroxylum novogranatense]|uniref:Transcription repressor n=1 Tax=Erythroxylum novogranatense TaxID=1862640 RepID=A0AAV8T4Y8_9ROSI|nr:hypothetical protein K2173_005414 [Erythroxylum novogranatense]